MKSCISEIIYWKLGLVLQFTLSFEYIYILVHLVVHVTTGLVQFHENEALVYSLDGNLCWNQYLFFWKFVL